MTNKVSFSVLSFENIRSCTLFLIYATRILFFFSRRFKCYVWRGFSKRNGFPPFAKERLLLDFNPTRSHATFNLLATPSHKTIRLSLISLLLDTDPVIEAVEESVRCHLAQGGSTPSSEREDVGNLGQCSNFASKNARYYLLPASAYATDISASSSSWQYFSFNLDVFIFELVSR